MDESDDSRVRILQPLTTLRMRSQLSGRIIKLGRMVDIVSGWLLFRLLATCLSVYLCVLAICVCICALRVCVRAFGRVCVYMRGWACVH